MTKKYQVSAGAMVSSYGNVNYTGASKGRLEAALQQVFADHPGAVVLDGSDDWFASECRSPRLFRYIFDIKPLASFHTGTSGLSSSGIVVSREDFEKIEREFPTKTLKLGRDRRKTDRAEGCVLREHVRVYEQPAGQETA